MRRARSATRVASGSAASQNAKLERSAPWQPIGGSGRTIAVAIAVAASRGSAAQQRLSMRPRSIDSWL